MNGIINTENLIMLLVRIFVILCCFPVHECAHAWTADRLGDPTPRQMGRISLNPFRHLDLFGTLTIFLFGVGYAKPVPVNLRYFRRPKRDFALTAVAGPLSNLLMAVIFLLILRFLPSPTSARSLKYYLMLSMYNAAYINVSLAVFNLIPIPPLDGSRVLTAILPDKAYHTVLKYERYSMIALIGLLIIFNRIGFSPISYLSSAVFRFLFNIVV